MRNVTKRLQNFLHRFAFNRFEEKKQALCISSADSLDSVAFEICSHQQLPIFPPFPPANSPLFNTVRYYQPTRKTSTPIT